MAGTNDIYGELASIRTHGDVVDWLMENKFINKEGANKILLKIAPTLLTSILLPNEDSTS